MLHSCNSYNNTLEQNVKNKTKDIVSYLASAINLPDLK